MEFLIRLTFTYSEIKNIYPKIRNYHPIHD